MRICFIVAPQNKSTILDRIAHEIGRQFDDTVYHYGISDIPDADHYFVTHYSLLLPVLACARPTIVLFTHDKGGLPDYVEYFNRCYAVIAESPEGMKLLASLGVNQQLLHFVPEGGDNIAFQPHARKADGAILICGRNYEDSRKNPELIKQVMEWLPNRQFLFCGQNWMPTIDGSNTIWEVTPDYSQYPSIYSKCSIYLSCSKLEGGGPNSLIEAMHSNLVPVVSDTGNARQYIVDGYNGFIFPLDATPEYVAELIEKAYKLQPQNSIPYNDVWQSVRSFGWKEYGLNMKEIIMGDYSVTASQSLDQIDDDEACDH